MAERTIALKSMVNAMVTVKKPEYGVNRKWSKRGQVVRLPYDTVEQLLWDNGFKHMIDTGILYIENLKDKQDLGLEPDDVTKPVNILVLNEKDLEEYWTKLPIDDFKRQVCRLSRVQVDNLISYGVETEHIDITKCHFIQELTGKDILKSISRKHEMEEIDRQEREGKRDADGRR